MTEQTYDHMLKLVVVGDSGVGKTSIVVRFCDDKFSEGTASTIGVDFKTKFMTISDQTLKLSVWDTAGQEKFRTLGAQYYRGAHGIVLMYDCTNRKTYDRLTFWQEDVKKSPTYQDAVVMLVHNKIDLKNCEVTKEQGRDFAEKNGMMFMETSAKTRQGVNQAFEGVIRRILESPDFTSGRDPALHGSFHVNDAGDDNSRRRCGC